MDEVVLVAEKRRCNPERRREAALFDERVRGDHRQPPFPEVAARREGVEHVVVVGMLDKPIPEDLRGDVNEVPIVCARSVGEVELD